MRLILNAINLLLIMALTMVGPGVRAEEAPALGAADTNTDESGLEGFGPPYANVEDLTERRFGIDLTDHYRWMENPDDSALYDWLRRQEDYTERQTAGELRDQLTREFGQIFAEPATAEALRSTEQFFKEDMLKHRFQFDKTDASQRAALMVSPRQRYEIIATPANTDIQTLQIKDNNAGMLLPDLLRVKFATVIWDASEASFVYSSMRDGRLGGATDIIRRHVLGKLQTADEVLVEAAHAEEYLGLSLYGNRHLLWRVSPEANKLAFVDLTSGEEQPIFQTRGGALITVPQVGVLDMTRFGLFTSGAGWNSEYGNRDDANDFRFLHSISPYHNLREGGRYPAALVMTSDQDDRVVPAHSYKFIARLQTALPGMRSLLHVAHGTGHGMLRAAERQENVRTAAIMWTFIMEELGVP